MPPGGRPAKSADATGAVLGAEQERAIISAALLGNSLSTIELSDRISGLPVRLPVLFLRVFFTPSSELGSITLIARGTDRVETTPQNVFASGETDPANCPVIDYSV